MNLFCASSPFLSQVFGEHRGDGVVWECPPVGAPAEVPEVKPYPPGPPGSLSAWLRRKLQPKGPSQQQQEGGEPASCVATSFHWNEIYQVTTLE